jgi:hypothetical protein
LDGGGGSGIGQPTTSAPRRWNPSFGVTLLTDQNQVTRQIELYIWCSVVGPTSHFLGNSDQGVREMNWSS